MKELIGLGIGSGGNGGNFLSVQWIKTNGAAGSCYFHSSQAL